MHVRLFLVTVLLAHCAGTWAVGGGASENSVSEKILASAGETVILPCHINITNDHIPEVEWSKEGPDSNIAFLYRDGCETYEMKNVTFQYRTNLFVNELEKGNISLRISNVQLSDAGTYICKTLQRPPRLVVTVELLVGAVSEPKLSVVPSVEGGMTLQCEANCWYPEPEITFLNEQGNNISAEDPKSDLDSGGCFTVTRRVTLQTATNSLTCRVHQPMMNLTRVTDIHIPDHCMRSCIPATIIAVLVTAALCAIIAFFCKKFGNSVGIRKLLVPGQSCNQRTTHRNAEVYRQRSQADDNRNATSEHLRIIDQLKLSLNDKEEKILQLTEELNDLKSKQRPIVCQHGQPTLDNSPSKSSPHVSDPISPPPHQVPQDNNPKPAASTNRNRPKSGILPKNQNSKPAVSIQTPASGPLTQRSSHNHSSPALSTDNAAVSPSSPSAFTSEERHCARSKSFSGLRRKSASPQRRYSISTNNPFGILEDLPEDSESLLPQEPSRNEIM